MKKIILRALISMGITGTVMAQKVKTADVPTVTKSALLKKYPSASNVTWEKEKGNFEANWGGKSGEEMSVQFTPTGIFLEQVTAISPAKLPSAIGSYVKKHYSAAKITEAGKVIDAEGKIMYEAEVKGKDLVFDEKGAFLKID